MKKLNSRKPFISGDEDRSQIETSKRSDVGEMDTYLKEQVTAAKKRDGIKRLLDNIEVRRWHDNLARGSKVTAYNRLKSLKRFCDIYNMTPMQVVDFARTDKSGFVNFLEDHVTKSEADGYSPGTINETLKTVRSLLNHFDIEIRRKIKITNPDRTPTLENERIPEAPELAEIFSRCDLRAGAVASLIAKAGLRPEVLGNFDGTDGLTMKDLPDIAIVQGVARCLRTPTMIIVRRMLSKARHQYFTFLTPLATKKILAYLNDRLIRGEAFGPDSPVLNVDHNCLWIELRKRKFLTTKQISKIVRDALRPRFQWRPYVLRAFFDTQLLIAEARGMIAHDFRVFFMGHKGSIEAKYTTNKGVLPESLLNEMREAYKRSERFLDLELSEEDPLLKQKEQAKIAIEKATPEMVQEILRFLSIGNAR